MNVVPIAREWIEIYPATVDGRAGWVLELVGMSDGGEKGGYVDDVYPSRSSAAEAARAWEMPIRFAD